MNNPYCTLDEFKADKRITSVDVADDAVIEGIIEDASRLIDRTCGRTFYLRNETRYYDRPRDGMLWFDDDLLALATLTNGDGTTIAESAYVLLPYNDPAKYVLELKRTSGVVWQVSGQGEPLRSISVAGNWGFVDRTATDALSCERIRITRSACLDIAVWEYFRRLGKDTETISQVTASGVVVVPAGQMPQSAWKKIKDYRRA